jgi:hypothetical protein
MELFKWWIYFLIKFNPGKFIWILIIIISLSLSSYLDKGPIHKNYQNVTWIDTTQKKMIYQENGSFKYLEFETSISHQWDQPHKKIQIVKEDSDGEITFNVILFMAIIFLMISLLLEALSVEEKLFDLPKVKKYTLSKFIRMDEEGGIYYYHLFGKLLAKSNNQVNDIFDYVLSIPLNNFIHNKNVLPDFNGTVQQKRDNILDKLLIKKP